MKVELANCKITVDYEYITDEDYEYITDEADRKNYFINIESPFPGGIAHFKIPTTQDVYNSLQYAQKLNEQRG